MECTNNRHTWCWPTNWIPEQKVEKYVLLQWITKKAEHANLYIFNSVIGTDTKKCSLTWLFLDSVQMYLSCILPHAAFISFHIMAAFRRWIADIILIEPDRSMAIPLVGSCVHAIYHLCTPSCLAYLTVVTWKRNAVDHVSVVVSLLAGRLLDASFKLIVCLAC